MRVLRERLAEIDSTIGNLHGSISEQDDRIKAAENKARVGKIREEFSDALSKFSKKLDVRTEERKQQKLSGVNIGRGSEGPRALLAYYFAFLRIARNHSSSAFCPIVIDAPNQQGQDRVHMPAMMRFMIDERPESSKLIIGAEDLFGLRDDEVDIIDVSGQKDHVLRQEQYEPVAAVVRPFLAQLN